MKTFRTISALGGCVLLLPTIAPAQTSPAPNATTIPDRATASEMTSGAAATTTPPPAAISSTVPPSIVTGSKVLDTAGATVGTIESVDGDYVVLATTRSKVRLPKTSFAIGPAGPIVAMTASQIDVAAAQAAPSATTSAAAPKPNVAPGAAVIDMQGGTVGIVAGVEGQFATVSLAGGGRVRLPVTAFGTDTEGRLRIAMTARQLGAAAGITAR